MKGKSHTKYYLKSGRLVPGATTILGISPKPALIYAAVKLAKEGKDYRAVWRDKAEIGSLVHAMILAHYQGKKPDTSDYDQNQINTAETCLIKFFDWEKRNAIEPIFTEKPLTSEKYEYGGTPDLYAKVNGDLTVVDFKTSKGIFREMPMQLAAYRQLIIEDGHEVTHGLIVRIGRKESQGFETRPYTNWEPYWNGFDAFRIAYRALKVVDQLEK